MHREPEVPEAKSQWKGVSIALQGLPQRNLHPKYSVENGILQNACFRSRRMDADLGKSAHTHTVRLMNSRLKGPKKMMTKVQ